MNKLQNIHNLQVLQQESFSLNPHKEYRSIEEPCACDFDSSKVKPPGGLCM